MVLLCMCRVFRLSVPPANDFRQRRASGLWARTFKLPAYLTTLSPPQCSKTVHIPYPVFVSGSVLRVDRGQWLPVAARRVVLWFGHRLATHAAVFSLHQNSSQPKYNVHLVWTEVWPGLCS